MVKTVPSLYGFLYDRVERAREAGSFRKLVSRLGAHSLHALIEELQPSCVVCTHAFPCGIMSQYKRTIDPRLPVVGVVTDYVVHPFWIYRNIDAYAVATEEMRNALRARSVPDDRIRITGIPVDPRFALASSKREALRELGLDPEERRKLVLVMAGGLGIGPLEMMLRALCRVRRPIAAAVLVGRNARREERLRAWSSGLPYPVQVRGFENNVFDYMHAADVLLTKPGGLTISEALAARLPMVLVKPLGGQEQRNTRYLVKQRAAMRADNEDAIARAVDRILATHPASRGRLLRRAESVRRPEAAADVAQIVRTLAGNQEGKRGVPQKVPPVVERWPSG
jgi:processive 1,2-diacylglycerol beta-glucosyltransferase